MHRVLRRLAWSGAVAALSAAPNIAGAQGALANTFRPLLDTEYRAMVQGDTAALGALLADDLVWIVGPNGSEMTRGQLLSAAAQSHPPAPRFIVDSVRAKRFGDVATVEYHRTDHRPMGDGEFVTKWKALDVFAMRRGRWLLERHTQVWLVSPVTPTALDSASMDAFAGHYQIRPGYVDNVHWEGKSLVATASGQSEGARLVPVATNVFSPDGDGALISFERDASGRVLGYVQGYPDGRVIRAPKLGAAQSDSTSRASRVQRGIEPLLAEMMTAANAHDTDRFMAAYLRDSSFVFVINGTVMNGWDAVRAQQLKWWNNGKSDVLYAYVGKPEFTVLSSDAAVVTERMSARRTLANGQTSTGELAVTMAMQKRPEGWRAVQVHESSAPPAPPATPQSK
jgi:ketosteroid isomerase-like protein